ncbi:MAG: hypothetical protein LBD68_11535, partial [Zoogloeaceae bacterium]|nr:hypothetical protein [Zoogloeaceae bacterium]
ARRLKTLNGLTPYEYLCKLWTNDPERFTMNPIQKMPGLNNLSSLARNGKEHSGFGFLSAFTPKTR